MQIARADTTELNWLPSSCHGKFERFKNGEGLPCSLVKESWIITFQWPFSVDITIFMLQCNRRSRWTAAEPSQRIVLQLSGVPLCVCPSTAFCNRGLTQGPALLRPPTHDWNS